MDLGKFENRGRFWSNLKTKRLIRLNKKDFRNNIKYEEETGVKINRLICLNKYFAENIWF